MRLVREIKKFHHNQVSHAMYCCGIAFVKPHRRPTNIEKMVEGLSRETLIRILRKLLETKR